MRSGNNVNRGVRACVVNAFALAMQFACRSAGEHGRLSRVISWSAVSAKSAPCAKSLCCASRVPISHKMKWCRKAATSRSITCKPAPSGRRYRPSGSGLFPISDRTELASQGHTRPVHVHTVADGNWSPMEIVEARLVLDARGDRIRRVSHRSH